MKVQVLYFDGCPNHQKTVELAEDVVRELGVDANVEEVEVKGPEDAKQVRFLGSPTVQVNGEDVEPAARSRSDFGFSCRPYNGKGMPERELIKQACLDALQESDNHD